MMNRRGTILWFPSFQRGHLAVSLFLVVMLTCGSLLALPQLSVFAKLDAIEAATDASRRKATLLQGDVDLLDERMDAALAESDVAGRAAIPLRLAVVRSLRAWLAAFESTAVGATPEDAYVSYLLRRSVRPALREKLSERKVLDRADFLKSQYRTLLYARSQSTVALAQAKASGEASGSARDSVIRATDPRDVGNALEATDEALNRSLSHLLRNKTERDFHKLKGTLIPPVKGTPKQLFGPRVTGHEISVRHTGLTYATKLGTPVRAASGGLVVYAHRFEGYGNMVIIDHGQGYHSVYAHMDRIDVKLDTNVSRGAILGVSGETGSLEGPKLYFELRHQGRAIDPVPWFLQRKP